MNAIRDLLVVLCCIVTFVSVSPAGTIDKQLEGLFGKDSVTILITDSGLGGVAVCAEIEQRLQSSPIFRHVFLVFCNALPEADYGYNKMAGKPEQLRVFDNALSGMAKAYRPDLLLIACNTLSVIYPDTRFADTTSIPVVGIVEFGVEMLYRRLAKDPASTAIVFGTPTTIQAGTHKRALVERGIAPTRIIETSCRDLETEIQADATSDMVQTMIQLYVAEAVVEVGNKRAPVFAGLCCSHYGYSAEFFTAAIRGEGVETVELVNPNHAMSDYLFARHAGNSTHHPGKTEVAVVSRAVLGADERKSIARLLLPVSPSTAAALEEYQLNRHLFDF